MPQHNTQSGSDKKRSAVTGRQLGKRATKAEEKNAESVVNFLSLVERTVENPSWRTCLKETPTAIPGESNGFILGRVIRGTGAGRLEVRLFSGEVVSAPVAGRLAFKGNSATKTDREACMRASDYVVLEGPYAAGKMRVSVAKQIATLYLTANPHLKAPKEFFDEEAEADQGFEFDRSEEAEEEVDVSAL
jgi:hypothetical protein